MNEALLKRIVNSDALHARWLNTLSYLEYVGARKIIKSQHEDAIDENVLEHAAEEIHHAYYLKKLLIRHFGVTHSTYAEPFCLAKLAAKIYIQSVDGLCAQSARDVRHAYLLTSYVIETRALKIYSPYEKILREMNSFSLSSILRQEHAHLREMEDALATFAEPHVLAQLVDAEEIFFADFVVAIIKDIDAHA